jgi:hypothetical protein
MKLRRAAPPARHLIERDRFSMRLITMSDLQSCWSWLQTWGTEHGTYVS